MPTTYTLDKLAPRRFTLSGDCDAPQGADGIGRLASSALAAMEAAAWVRDDSAASMPVHEYDRARPGGDAYKAAYGYDRDGRTERACCGAVCYVVPMPAGPWADGSSAPSSVAALVRGDRYLDQGADVSIVASGSPDPLPWADVLALASTTVCATSGQEDAGGDPLAPNRRTGVSETVQASPGRARYYHIYVRLHDYLGVREAWVEGGAMLEGLEIAFDAAGFDGLALPGGAGHGAPCGLGTVVADHSADGAAALRGSYSGAFCCSLRFPSPWDDDLFAPPAFDPADRSHLGMLAAAALVRWRVPEGDGRYAFGHGVAPWGEPIARLASRQGADVAPGATLADGLFGYRLADGVPVPFALLLCLPVVAPRGLAFSGICLADGVRAPDGLVWSISAWIAAAPPPLATDGSARHLLSASPDPESLDYSGLADGSARALAMRTASGTSAMALSPLARAVREGAAAGPLDVPAAASVAGRASLVLCLSPVEYDSPGPGDCLATVRLDSTSLL